MSLKIKNFKDTLNLPRTDFPIRSNAKVDDAIMIQRWADEDLYGKSFICNEGSQKFILMDGPPYANSHIHLGTAYNKILKDIIAKSQRMQGKHVPVTPGWDCHGLPIEFRVKKENPELAGAELKKACREYALKWIDVQRQEFKNLGVLMNWDKPYLTMSPEYMQKTLESFGYFFEEGYIDKKDKTVPWCASCETVLATAEIEYADRKDPSIYVSFALPEESVATLFPNLSGKSVSVVIWTTTPWTIPLNRAVLANPNAEYIVLEKDSAYFVVAKELAEQVCVAAGIEQNIVAQIKGSAFEGVRVKHPLIADLTVPIILNKHVSLKDGTAFVHCAPGCGPEDYEVGVKNNLEIYSPISTDGCYTDAIKPAEFAGMKVAEAHGPVIKKLLENGALFAKTSIKHSYPHCWRCRNGLIFRATKQWFLDLSHDNLREKALEIIEQMKFYPERSKNYLKATVQGRLEWCLSRQRAWGTPIPALLCKQCGAVSPTTHGPFIDAVASEIAKGNVNYWDTVTVNELIGSIDPPVKCLDCGSTEFEKETDILDVWFDAGVSHTLTNDREDMYLEGVDQHRGFFQSSLLTSVGLEIRPAGSLGTEVLPQIKSILTHGFTVDAKGHKMSKSVGNVVAPNEITAKIGTDGLRLWVASIDYKGDAVVSEKLLKNVSEVFRKIRNTCRFLLSNLYDFDSEKDAVPFEKLLSVDKFALQKLVQFNQEMVDAYNNADATGVFHGLADYCTKDLSQLYLDVTKDRLYVEKADGHERRSAQTVYWYILDALTKLIAPVLSITAEQLSDNYQKGKTKSIHLQNFATLPFRVLNDNAQKKWRLIFGIRDALLKSIEAEREKGLIKHPLEVSLSVYFNFDSEKQAIMNTLQEQLKNTGQAVEDFFKELLVVSEFTTVKNDSGLNTTEMEGLSAKITAAQGVKCPRCWHISASKNEQNLCSRCAEIAL